MSEIVIEVPRRDLPQALVQSSDYQELSERERQNFVARLRYIEEIPFKVREMAEVPTTSHVNEEMIAFLDRIELDLMINIGSTKQASEQVSPWLVHTSWTFETSATAMVKSLNRDSLRALGSPLPAVCCTVGEFMEWISSVARELAILLDAFYSSKSFDNAMGNVLLMDACLARMLAAVIAQRLNPGISR